MTQNLNIQAGEVIVFTEGAYSDYGICGSAVATKAFNVGEEVGEFNKTREGAEDRIIAHLIAKGLIIPVAHREIYLSRDGGFDLV